MNELPQLSESNAAPLPGEPRERRAYWVLCAAMVGMAIGYLFYSQTWAFAWDEGFHMLTAQLIREGRRPYLDFFFPQAPLNAYWNAGWLRVFGESWRVVHALAAVLTVIAIFLTVDFVYRRFPVARWRLATTLLVAALMGANVQVFQFGPVGQGYALALVLSVAALRVTVWAAELANPLGALAAGLLASAAACSTLLAAPYTPVLLLWLVIYSRTGSRWMKSAAYLAGAVVPWIPVILLYVQSPENVRFNILDYHMRYREVDWSDAIPHDIDVLAGWLESGQALIIGVLAIAGLIYVYKVTRRWAATDPATREEVEGHVWERSHRRELYLCAWLAIAEAIHISRAHPTFPRYFLLLVAPLSILAAPGIYVVGSRLGSPDRPWWAVAPTLLILFLGTAKATYDERDNMHWDDLEKIGNKVNSVTPPGAPILADEQIYFLSGRTPPEGLEHRDSHKLALPAALSKRLHVFPKAELKKRVVAGRFATVQSCEEEDMTSWGITDLYEHSAEFEDCKVFWGLKAGTQHAADAAGAKP